MKEFKAADYSYFFQQAVDLTDKAARNYFLAGGDLLPRSEQPHLGTPGAAQRPDTPERPAAGGSAAATAPPANAGAVGGFKPAGGFHPAGGLGGESKAAPGPVSTPSPPPRPPIETPQEVAMRVNIQSKTVQMGKKTLLKDVNFQVLRGDFMLILGGSGAGKTTLIRSILGETRANGTILLNGKNLYTNFKSMKSQIGLVPQFLTLRLNDTVRSTVTDAAYIRLGGTFSSAEIRQRVDRVLDKVGITELQDSLICNLSGGQKKKVSVAVQLVGFQQVFICDEPDSGLDAASRVQLMELLKEISNSGKIVMVITHYPDDAIDLFSRVVVLAKSGTDKAGHLAYAGDVAGALRTFHVEHLQDIVKEINPPYEGGKGLADEYIKRWSVTRA